MAQVINTNVAALFAGAALNKSALALQTAQQRLSSGLRINSAKDDPTGLVIATDYDSQIRGTNIAIQGANNAISTAQTNDGYAGQIIANLQRLYEIAVQLGGTASGAETTALTAENARIAGLTTAATAVTVDGNGTTKTGVSAKITAPTNVTVAGITTDLGTVNTARSQYGADMATFGSAVATMQVTSVNLSAAYSRIMDTDYAAESTAMTRNNILQQAGSAVLAQANQTPNSVLTLLR
ncbi:flagellin [Sideroxydans lithotrophicus]|uniref:Flagellin n=1 Tax=Sideroxydans lithotrophicus (strain ES-1) TaxID=580332 RepID=D5CN24_SIDLE|nr:flagellin [Sideroxydans lithotrophicus]ADE10860.1 flagellin domain protein [Sideroxydans lithotrophicus ES-1]